VIRIAYGPLVGRALGEHKPVVLGLAALLVINVVGYAFFVHTLRTRVDNVTELTRAAENDLAAALREHTQAKELVAGRASAATSLDRFYAQVLPVDLAAARRIASPRLSQLAREAGARTRSIGATPDSDPDHTLTRLQIPMGLTGSYDSIRRFIHQIERAKEFVVIENVEISKESEEDGELRLELDLATFYKDSAR
jgi:Tfp pilus assembly protein PilO